MKKTLLAAIALGAMSVFSAANAATVLELNPRGYIGADYKYIGQMHSDDRIDDSEYAKSALKKYGHALGLTTGVQLNDYFGVEASVATTVSNIAKASDTDVDVTLYSVGVTGQYPIVDNFYLKGMIGAGWSHIDAKETFEGDKYYYNDTESSFVGRIGIGHQLSHNSVVEATYNYEMEKNGFALQYKYLF